MSLNKRECQWAFIADFEVVNAIQCKFTKRA